MSVNKHILIGNLGKDPEVKTLENGTKVANLSLATTHKYKGEKETDWHNVVAFGKSAEVIEMFVTKGSRLYVEGRSRTRVWDDKDGNKRYTTEVVGNQMQMLGRRGSGMEPQEMGAAPVEPSEAAAPTGNTEDDLPF